MSDEKKLARRKLVSFLQIDCLLRRAELFKQAPDYESALVDLKEVEALCIEFPEKNEDTLISSIFQRGTCQLDLKRRDEAKESFAKVQEMQRKKLEEMLAKASNQTVEEAGKSSLPLSELIKESIFDTDEIKMVKGFLV